MEYMKAFIKNFLSDYKKNSWGSFVTICNYLLESSPSESSSESSESSESLSESSSEISPESESDFSSVFMNLSVCIFFILYLHSSK